MAAQGRTATVVGQTDRVQTRRPHPDQRAGYESNLESAAHGLRGRCNDAHDPIAQKWTTRIGARLVGGTLLDAPLGLLDKSLLLAVLAFAQGLGETVPDLKPEDTITGAHAIAIGHEILGDIFPTMRD